ncbi:hypothetical protein [Ruminococcus sp.]
MDNLDLLYKSYLLKNLFQDIDSMIDNITLSFSEFCDIIKQGYNWYEI